MNKNKKKLSLNKITIETLDGSPSVAGGTATLTCHYTYVSCPAGSCGCGGGSSGCASARCFPCVGGY